MVAAAVLVGIKKQKVGRVVVAVATVVVPQAVVGGVVVGACVGGAVGGGGQLRVGVGRRGNREALHRFLADNIADDAGAVYTDELQMYGTAGLADEDTRHETVNHSKEEWVRGDVHTNTIEGVWSLFKRSIIGSYHHLSVKHLPAYLDELEWRFNNRDNPYLFRDTLRVLVTADPLTYAAFTRTNDS